MPDGAFYCYPSVKGGAGPRAARPGAAYPPRSWRSWCWTRSGVAVVPGEAFGTPGYLRLSYALGDDDLARGVRRLVDLLAEVA